MIKKKILGSIVCLGTILMLSISSLAVGVSVSASKNILTGKYSATAKGSSASSAKISICNSSGKAIVTNTKKSSSGKLQTPLTASTSTKTKSSYAMGSATGNNATAIAKKSY